jgi:predicted  nucleic acid-binding Zn-ribbon protein
LEELNIIKNTLTQYTLEYEIKLKEVNEKLWKIEDDLRKLEKEQRFDEEFIELARNVYIVNDERAKIKKEINELTNSNYKEIKIY